MDFKQHLRDVAEDELSIEQAFLKQCDDWVVWVLAYAERTLEENVKNGKYYYVRKGLRKHRIVNTPHVNSPPYPPENLRRIKKKYNRGYSDASHPSF